MISGNGSNLQALIDGVNNGSLAGVKIVQVISNNPSAHGSKRGIAAKIPTYCFEKPREASQEEGDENLFEILEEERPDLVVLAGYLRKIQEPVLSAYKNRIINIHPSLLPKYGGPGFYGIKVHQAVIEAREIETGVTVHFVDQDLDSGRIIIQERIAIDPGDTPEGIAKKVLDLEHKVLVQAVKKIAENRY